MCSKDQFSQEKLSIDGSSEQNVCTNKKHIGRKPKQLPDRNHIYILRFIGIMYNKPVNTWDDIVNVSISITGLQQYKPLEKYKSENIHTSFRKIFRVHDTQKLRHEIKNEKDLISLLRCIAKKYQYMLRSSYGNKDTRYIMVK